MSDGEMSGDGGGETLMVGGLHNSNGYGSDDGGDVGDKNSGGETAPST